MKTNKIVATILLTALLTTSCTSTSPLLRTAQAENGEPAAAINIQTTLPANPSNVAEIPETKAVASAVKESTTPEKATYGDTKGNDLKESDEIQKKVEEAEDEKKESEANEASDIKEPVKATKAEKSTQAVKTKPATKPATSTDASEKTADDKAEPGKTSEDEPGRIAEEIPEPAKKDSASETKPAPKKKESLVTEEKESKDTTEKESVDSKEDAGPKDKDDPKEISTEIEQEPSPVEEEPQPEAPAIEDGNEPGNSLTSLLTVKTGKNYYVDLNGDGKNEVLRYGKNNVMIDEVSYDRDPVMENLAMEGLNRQEMAVFDVDSDGINELIFLTSGPSDDYAFHLVQLTNKGLKLLGGLPLVVTEDLKAAFPGNGIIRGYQRLQVLQTWYAKAEYKWNGGNEFTCRTKLFSPIAQKNYEVAKLLVDLPIYESMGDSEPSSKMAPQNVTFGKTDDKTWIVIEGEDGTSGWFKVSEGGIYATDLDMWTDQVFEGLFYAD